MDIVDRFHTGPLPPNALDGPLARPPRTRRRPRGLPFDAPAPLASPVPAPASFARGYLDRLTTVLTAMDAAAIDAAVEAIRRVWLAGGQVITLGNGGSAITALHFATDWSKGVFAATGRRFRGRSLVDNMGVLTAYANDACYADVFVEQLRNLADPGDLVLAISGSGNSENVIRAVAYANAAGCETLGLVGFSGGRLRGIARHVVWARVDDMQLAEDVHAMFGHIVMQALGGVPAGPRAA